MNPALQLKLPLLNVPWILYSYTFFDFNFFFAPQTQEDQIPLRR